MCLSGKILSPFEKRLLVDDFWKSLSKQNASLIYE